eukprot:GFUD01007353.1.p1 GENE.GFUD01007353.1~~GFUD01007353.1.p1  ORF type:complete len:187 (-),score=49.27 GFUD01007353.1:77-637(-)
MKKRQPSGDSVSESSGYCSNVEGQNALEDTLREEDALKILSLNKLKGCPLLACQNSIRGCPVTSYPRIIGLHQEMCKFPEVKKFTVKSKLNLHQALSTKFRTFNQAFEKSRQVSFLFKKTKDCSSVKICAQHYGKEENSFTLTLYDKRDRHLHKISDKTGLKIHIIPAKVFKEVGSIVKYKIQISK